MLSCAGGPRNHVMRLRGWITMESLYNPSLRFRGRMRPRRQGSTFKVQTLGGKKNTFNMIVLAAPRGVWGGLELEGASTHRSVKICVLRGSFIVIRKDSEQVTGYGRRYRHWSRPPRKVIARRLGPPPNAYPIESCTGALCLRTRVRQEPGGVGSCIQVKTQCYGTDVR